MLPHIRTYAFTHLLIYSFTLFLLSCSEPPSTPPPYVRTVFLSEEYAGVTHASLRLTFYDTTGTREFALRRDGALIMEGVMQAGDTVLVDTSLLPARNYTYRAYRLRDGAVRDSSALLQVTTMDTTSHDFTWEITYLGDGQSYLKDVFAISDTDVWAVGQIYLRDSTGGFGKMYNAAHWDGKKWKLHAGTYVPFNCVFGFASNDVWMGTSAPYHWDGHNWKGYNVQGIFNGWINKIWGRSSSDLYFVGDNGSIMHYDGQKFERQESGTEVGLTDIYGVWKNKIYACGELFAGVVLEYDDSRWSVIDSLSGNGQTARLTVFCTKDFFALGGDSTWYIDRGWGNVLLHPPAFVARGKLPFGKPVGVFSIRGTARNNVFAVGGWGFLMHYNGMTWKWIEETWYDDGFLSSLSVTKDKVYAVGDRGNRGWVVVGTRK